jgi:hypothetical protein
MVDPSDVAENAAGAVLQRERATEPLPHQIINVVAPETLTGPGIAAIWSDLLEKPVKYAGGETASLEKQIGQHAPSRMAVDLRLTVDRFQSDGMRAAPSDIHSARPLASVARETLAA